MLPQYSLIDQVEPIHETIFSPFLAISAVFFKVIMAYFLFVEKEKNPFV